MWREEKHSLGDLAAGTSFRALTVKSVPSMSANLTVEKCPRVGYPTVCVPTVIFVSRFKVTPEKGKKAIAGFIATYPKTEGILVI